MNGGSSSWGTTWLTRPSCGPRRHRELPVSDISMHAAQTDRLSQQDGDAAAGHDPDPGVRVDEPRLLRPDEEGALEHDIEAACGSHPVDRYDHRLFNDREEPMEPIAFALGALTRPAQARRGPVARDLLEVDTGATAGSAPVRIIASTSGSSPSDPTASHSPYMTSRLNTLRASGRLEGDRGDPGPRLRPSTTPPESAGGLVHAHSLERWHDAERRAGILRADRVRSQDAAVRVRRGMIILAANPSFATRLISGRSCKAVLSAACTQFARHRVNAHGTQSTCPRRDSEVDMSGFGYDLEGAGDPALLFLHGWCCDLHLLRAPQFDYFSATHRVVSVDLPGCGESAVPSEYSIEAFASEVGELAGALGLWARRRLRSQFGHADRPYALAQQTPQFVAAVVMVDPPADQQRTVWEGLAAAAHADARGPRRARRSTPVSSKQLFLSDR